MVRMVRGVGIAAVVGFGFLAGCSDGATTSTTTVEFSCQTTTNADGSSHVACTRPDGSVVTEFDVSGGGNNNTNDDTNTTDTSLDCVQSGGAIVCMDADGNEVATIPCTVTGDELVCGSGAAGASGASGPQGSSGSKGPTGPSGSSSSFALITALHPNDGSGSIDDTAVTVEFAAPVTATTTEGNESNQTQVSILKGSTLTFGYSHHRMGWGVLRTDDAVADNSDDGCNLAAASGQYTRDLDQCWRWLCEDVAATYTGDDYNDSRGTLVTTGDTIDVDGNKITQAGADKTETLGNGKTVLVYEQGTWLYDENTTVSPGQISASCPDAYASLMVLEFDHAKWGYSGGNYDENSTVNDGFWNEGDAVFVLPAYPVAATSFRNQLEYAFNEQLGYVDAVRVEGASGETRTDAYGNDLTGFKVIANYTFPLDGYNSITPFEGLSDTAGGAGTVVYLGPGLYFQDGSNFPDTYFYVFDGYYQFEPTKVTFEAGATNYCAGDGNFTDEDSNDDLTFCFFDAANNPTYMDYESVEAVWTDLVLGPLGQSSSSSTSAAVQIQKSDGTLTWRKPYIKGVETLADNNKSRKSVEDMIGVDVILGGTCINRTATPAPGLPGQGKCNCMTFKFEDGIGTKSTINGETLAIAAYSVWNMHGTPNSQPLSVVLTDSKDIFDFVPISELDYPAFATAATKAIAANSNASNDTLLWVEGANRDIEHIGDGQARGDDGDIFWACVNDVPNVTNIDTRLDTAFRSMVDAATNVSFSKLQVSGTQYGFTDIKDSSTELNDAITWTYDQNKSSHYCFKGTIANSHYVRLKTSTTVESNDTAVEAEDCNSTTGYQRSLATIKTFKISSIDPATTPAFVAATGGYEIVRVAYDSNTLDKTWDQGTAIRIQTTEPMLYAAGQTVGNTSDNYDVDHFYKAIAKILGSSVTGSGYYWSKADNNVSITASQLQTELNNTSNWSASPPGSNKNGTTSYTFTFPSTLELHFDSRCAGPYSFSADPGSVKGKTGANTWESYPSTNEANATLGKGLVSALGGRNYITDTTLSFETDEDCVKLVAVGYETNHASSKCDKTLTGDTTYSDTPDAIHIFANRRLDNSGSIAEFREAAIDMWTVEKAANSSDMNGTIADGQVTIVDHAAGATAYGFGPSSTGYPTGNFSSIRIAMSTTSWLDVSAVLSNLFDFSVDAAVGDTNCTGNTYPSVTDKSCWNRVVGLASYDGTTKVYPKQASDVQVSSIVGDYLTMSVAEYRNLVANNGGFDSGDGLTITFNCEVDDESALAKIYSWAQGADGSGKVWVADAQPNYYASGNTDYMTYHVIVEPGDFWAPSSTTVSVSKLWTRYQNDKYPGTFYSNTLEGTFQADTAIANKTLTFESLADDGLSATYSLASGAFEGGTWELLGFSTPLGVHEDANGRVVFSDTNYYDDYDVMGY